MLSVKVVERANTALPGSPQTQSTAKITIESINLKVPHLTPNDDIKLQLLTRIKADEPMMIPFRRWELHELPALTQGSTIEIWSVKTCSALDSPRYVIVFFQTKKADNLHEDVTLFDNANIKSIRLALNSDYYPQERMLLDFSKDQYADAHFNYKEFNKSYHNCQEKRSLVNFAEFKSRPMFVIDCSRRHLGLKSSTVDIKLDIEATTGFPPDTKAYCIIIHDQTMEHLPLSEINLEVTAVAFWRALPETITYEATIQLIYETAWYDGVPMSTTRVKSSCDSRRDRTRPECMILQDLNALQKAYAEEFSSLAKSWSPSYSKNNSELRNELKKRALDFIGDGLSWCCEVATQHKLDDLKGQEENIASICALQYNTGVQMHNVPNILFLDKIELATLALGNTISGANFFEEMDEEKDNKITADFGEPITLETKNGLDETTPDEENNVFVEVNETKTDGSV
ncbi:unnamed protein product [Phaedon cochleariae]|uniref:Double jelly roll-like domain-containing protein n=1 Tax=Phaedon cochleariae TaxID=80249 RepID=A0A9N9SIP4_PHACE|nr:unnamed protein product [Phaedon cochleariae]